MAIRPAFRPSSVVVGYAAGFIVGGAVTIAGVLSRWTTSSGIGASTGIDFNVGRIILSLGIVAVFMGLVAAFNRSTVVGVLVAGTGCALSAAVLSLAVREIRDIQAYQDIVAFISRTLAEASG